MKRIFSGFFVCLALTVPEFAARSVYAQPGDATVLRLMEQYDVPGLALAIVRGDSIFLSGYGYSNAGLDTPVTPDTPFRIASVAKTLVAATVLESAAAGYVSLKSDISGLVRNDGPFGGQFGGPVRIHDLLTHTAGYDERLVGYAARTSDDMIPLGEYLASRMPNRGWPANEQVSYSNHGMSLAAYGVEYGAEKSFASVAASKLFRPLKMFNTAFITKGMDVPAGAATPLKCSSASCTPVEHVFSHAYPAGLAFSTARDMSNFVSAVLKAEISDSPLSELIPLRFTHDKRIPGMSYAFFNQIHAGQRVLAHAGNVPGYWSLIMIAPDAKAGFFFVTNGGSSRFGERLRDELLREIVGNETFSPPVAAVTEDAALRAGVYESTRYSHRTIERFPQAFANSIELSASGDTLELVSAGRLQKYIQIDEALYQRIDGSDLIAFGNRRGEPRLFRSSFVYGAGLPAAYEKRPSYRAPHFLNEYVSWLLVGPFLLLFPVWPVFASIGAYFRRKKGGEPLRKRKTSRAATLVAFATAVLFGVFGFLFVARSNSLLRSGELFFGMPDSLSTLVWMPLLHIALSAVLLVALVFAWRNKWWDWPRRILYTLVVLGLALQVTFLVSWNYALIQW